MSVFDRLGEPDPARVRDELLTLKDPERRQRAKAAGEALRRGRLWDGRSRPSARQRAVVLEWVGTATARQIVTDFWRISFVLIQDSELADDVYVVLASRGRSFFATLARGLLRREGGWRSWPLIRRAVREGLIEQPEGDEYLRQLVISVGPGLSGMRDVESVYTGLLADPMLLEREVWQLFEIDVSSELAGATTWEPRDPNVPSEGISRGDNRWLYAFVRLADEGRLDRERLLDASLDALMRDFRASSVGWYAKLHEELSPTHEERLQRLERYLALVTSPVPAVVGEGLTALRRVEDALSPEAFARVAQTPFSFRQKNLAVETLALLGRLCARHPGARPALLAAAVPGLGHERKEVQERALKLLEAYPDDVPRAEVLVYAEGVASTLRARVEAVTGIGVAEPVAGAVEIPQPFRPRLTWDVVRETRTELVPVESVDELIELAADLLEGQGDGDGCERFLDGVSRLCDRRGGDFKRRTTGLAKRAEATLWAEGGTAVIGSVVLSWTRKQKPRQLPTRQQSVLGFLAERALEVAHRAARGSSRELLAFPTHGGGWIDPDVLQERERSVGRFFNRPTPIDREQARARGFPELSPPEYGWQVKTRRRWGSTTDAFVAQSTVVPSELGTLGPLVADAGVIEDSSWYGPRGWGGEDALGVRWALTVLPSLPQLAFAAAAADAIASRDGAAYHHPDAVIAYALDASVPLGREAWLATAACLVAKSPDLSRVAADLVVSSVADGRFDGRSLGQAIAWLADNDFAKLNRLEAPLRDVARVSSLHGAQVVVTAESVLAHLAVAPRTLHSLLDVVVEASSATGRRIEDERARAFLGTISETASRSSKLGTLTRSLLAS